MTRPPSNLHESQPPARRAIVYGLGKMAINGSATTRRGASVEAELVRPVGSGGDVYWVRFDGDLDEQKQPVTRIRRVEKFLT